MASYSRKPNYHFKDKNSTGIDKVPAGRQIIIEDYDGDGSGKIKKFVKKGGAAASITSTTTMEEILNSDAVEGSGDLENSVMSKAQFEAMAEMRRNQFAGSGFVEFGYGKKQYDNINQGMYTSNDDWAAGKISLGYNTSANKVVGDSKSPEPIINVNGYKLKINGLQNLQNNPEINQISFPEAPDAFVISDSSNLPQAMKQGDFAILRNFDRNLVKNGDFSSEIDENMYGSTGNISITDEKLKLDINNTSSSWAGFDIINIPLIKGVKYEISVDFIEGNSKDEFGFYIEDRYVLDYQTGHTEGTTVKKIFTAKNSSKAHLQIVVGKNSNTDDEYYIFDNLSIKQSSETPIVALQDVEANIDIYENTDKFQVRDSVSRQDLVFLESWHEDISEKGIVYPYGNVQYRGTDTDGLSGISNGSFTGAGTYSLFGNWQNENDLVGKGYIWNNMSEQDKVKFVGNPDNNIYADGDKYIQVRYRIRVVKGLGNDWEGVDPSNASYGRFHGKTEIYDKTTIKPKGKQHIIPYDMGDRNTETTYGVASEYGTTKGGLSYFSDNNEKGIFGVHTGMNPDSFSIKGQCFALPIALVQRRNQGAFHPVYNSEGSSLIANFNSDNVLNGTKEWWEVKDYVEDTGGNNIPTKMSDIFMYQSDRSQCCSENYSSSIVSNGYYGRIESTRSGRPDGLFYDEINERDIQDLRMNAEKVNYDELMKKYISKTVTNSLRGKEYNLYTVKHPVEYKNISTSFNVDNNHKAFKVRHLDDSIIDRIETSDYNYSENAIYYHIVGSNGNIIKLECINGKELQWAHTNGDGSVYLYVKDSQKLYHPQEFPFEDGEILSLFITKRSNIISNNKHLHCEIIGDPKNYPSDWNDYKLGFFGIPSLVKYDNTNLLPINNRHNDYGLDYIYLSRKNISNSTYPSAKLIIAILPDGSKRKLNFAPDWNKVDGNNDVYWFYRDGIAIGLKDVSSSDINKCVFQVFYETKNKYLDKATKSTEVLKLNKEINTSGRIDYHLGGNITDNLINKICVADYHLDYTTIGSIDNFRIEYWNSGEIDNNVMVPSHNGSFSVFVGAEKPFSKWFSYLTEKNNKAYLQFVFKELKWDEDSDVIWDSTITNLAFPAADKDPVIIKADGTPDGGNILGGGDYGDLLLDVTIEDLESLSMIFDIQDNSDAWVNIVPLLVSHRVTSGRSLDSDVVRYIVPLSINQIKSFRIKANSGDGASIKNLRLIRNHNYNYTNNNLGSWGDDNKFQITDGISTMTDDNGNKVLYGQKGVELPYFID